MTITETIVSFAVKKVLDKGIGGPISVITTYHKTHFVFLYKIIKESERDWDIRKGIWSIQENLAKFIEYGKKLLLGIPGKPEPPSDDLGVLIDKKRNAEYSALLKDFGLGIKNVIEYLREYVAKARDVESRTIKELDDLEKRLDLKKASSVNLRKISNASRQKEIDLIRIDEMQSIREIRSQVEARLHKYENF